jgi:ABC-type bacteriocin/lantibiotic exporter with double-glycine peptidase domain
MDIKKITYIITNKLEGLSLALPMFLVGLGFMILGVTLWPVIGIVVGIFTWWVAWRFMLSSSRKSQIKEALKRIKEKQATLLSPSRSKYKAPTPESDVKKDSGTK